MYYTYAYLREDRTPYYIGKGSGDRINKNHGRPCSKPPLDRRIKLKIDLTEEEAFRHEEYMITLYGRLDLGTGILYNKSDGGEGKSGMVHSQESKSYFSKIFLIINAFYTITPTTKTTSRLFKGNYKSFIGKMSD